MSRPACRGASSRSRTRSRCSSARWRPSITRSSTRPRARSRRRPPTMCRRRRSGSYFTKINCFCFTQQTMKAGETREMTVVFYVDPALDKDRDQTDLNTITLSYTFYRLPDAERPVAEGPGDAFEQIVEENVRGAFAARIQGTGTETKRWPTPTPNITTTTWSIRARGRRSAPCPPSSWRSAPSAGCITCTPPRRWCSASACSACSTPSSAGGATSSTRPSTAASTPAWCRSRTATA